jgi:GNAT superfamily N-acetyltransferase
MAAGSRGLGLAGDPQDAPKQAFGLGQIWVARRDTHRVEPAAFEHPQVRALTEAHRDSPAGAAVQGLETLWRRGARLLVLRDADDEVLGCAAVALDSGEVAGLLIEPAQRRTGLGERLLRGIERDARRARCHRLWLRAGTHQHAALRLFERLDYERCDGFSAPQRQTVLMAKGL